ncbi:MAG: 50S ribosomal protein L9 [Chitinophagales bacterium]
MQVVLLEDVEKLGAANDIVDVKPGYGRNYLIPQGKALFANEGNKKIATQKLRLFEKRQEEMMKNLQEIVDKLKGTVVKVGAKVGANDKIFGSVTSAQLVDAVKKQLDIEIDRKKVEIEEDVKTLGAYKAQVGLHKDVTVEVNFEVVAE